MAKKFHESLASKLPLERISALGKVASILKSYEDEDLNALDKKLIEGFYHRDLHDYTYLARSKNQLKRQINGNDNLMKGALFEAMNRRISHTIDNGIQDSLIKIKTKSPKPSPNNIVRGPSSPDTTQLMMKESSITLINEPSKQDNSAHNQANLTYIQTDVEVRESKDFDRSRNLYTMQNTLERTPTPKGEPNVKPLGEMKVKARDNNSFDAMQENIEITEQDSLRRSLEDSKDGGRQQI